MSAIDQSIENIMYVYLTETKTFFPADAEFLVGLVVDRCNSEGES